MAVEIVYETHATSEDNEAGIATGWLPVQLSRAGRRQAAELGARRRDTGLSAVFTSDLRRAVEPAEIAFAGTGISIDQDARLRECDYGELNGCPVQQVAAERRHRIDTPFPAVRATAKSSRPLPTSWVTSPGGGTVSEFC